MTVSIASLINLLIVVAVVGFLVWAVITYVPMPEPFKRAILLITLFAVLLWFLRWAGLW